MGKQGRRIGGRPRKGVSISVKPAPPFLGDHGTGTANAVKGTEVVAIKDDKNNTGRRQKKNILSQMLKDELLTQRQYQAGEEIEISYCKVGMLSSGGAIGERVQSSPKPDAAVARQIDAISRLANAMAAVPRGQRALVEHVCCMNQPLRTSGVRRAGDRLRVVLDRVADRLGY